MTRASIVLSLLALTACPAGKTKEDKGSAPEKDHTGASGGDGQEGNQTSGHAEEATVDAGGGGTSTLYVLNATSDYDICWVYADTCDGVEGDDLLGDYYLPPDYYLAVTGLPDDCYDLWAFDCDDGAIWYYETSIEGEFTWILTSDGGGYDSGYDTGYDSGF